MGIFVSWTVCHRMDYGTAMKSQWTTDIMEVSNDDLKKVYRAAGENTECCPYECNYPQGGNIWLNPDGSRLAMYQGL